MEGERGRKKGKGKVEDEKGGGGRAERRWRNRRGG